MLYMVYTKTISLYFTEECITVYMVANYQFFLYAVVLKELCTKFVLAQDQCRIFLQGISPNNWAVGFLSEMTRCPFTQTSKWLTPKCDDCHTEDGDAM